jgi:hypothetical protein
MLPLLRIACASVLSKSITFTRRSATVYILSWILSLSFCAASNAMYRSCPNRGLYGFGYASKFLITWAAGVGIAVAVTVAVPVEIIVTVSVKVRDGVLVRVAVRETVAVKVLVVVPVFVAVMVGVEV